MSSQKDSLAVVVPCFNDESVIEDTYRRIMAAVAPLNLRIQVILVNDASNDSTWEKIRRLHNANPAVTTGVNLSRNFGHEAALAAGLDRVDADAAVIMDSDLQDPPELIPELVEKWRDGFDVVTAVRLSRSGEGPFKRLTAYLYYRLLALSLPNPPPKDAGNFRLLSRPALNALLQMRETHRLTRALAVWAGFRQTTVSFNRNESGRDHSGYTVGRLLSLALDGLLSFSVLPLRLASATGFILFTISFLAAAGLIVMKIGWGIPYRGWTSLFVAICLLGGIQLLFLGIIGEYIGRIFQEVKRRPLYIVAEVVEKQ